MYIFRICTDTDRNGTVLVSCTDVLVHPYICRKKRYEMGELRSDANCDDGKSFVVLTFAYDPFLVGAIFGSCCFNYTRMNDFIARNPCRPSWSWTL